MLVPGLVLVVVLASVRERPIFKIVQVLVDILILVLVLLLAIAVLFKISIGKSINTGSNTCNNITISIDICISIRGCILRLKISVHDLSISVEVSICEGNCSASGAPVC